MAAALAERLAPKTCGSCSNGWFRNAAVRRTSPPRGRKALAAIILVATPGYTWNGSNAAHRSSVRSRSPHPMNPDHLSLKIRLRRIASLIGDASAKDPARALHLPLQWRACEARSSHRSCTRLGRHGCVLARPGCHVSYASKGDISPSIYVSECPPRCGSQGMGA